MMDISFTLKITGEAMSLDELAHILQKLAQFETGMIDMGLDIQITGTQESKPDDEELTEPDKAVVQ